MTALESAVRTHAALVVVPAAGLALNILFQLVLGRLPLSIGHIRRQFIGFGAGFLFTAAGLIAILELQQPGASDFAGYFGLNLLDYVFMGFCFFHVINLNISSLRIRMLKEYLRQDPAPLSESDLTSRYSARAMLDARLARLQSGNQICFVDGRYHARPGGVVVIGHIFSGLRRLVLPG
jgi:hypothetical protein